MQEVIAVQNLGKRFKQYHVDRPRTLMEAALSGWRRITPVQQFWALRDINFTVSAGEMLGILGRNGAGKSTLLQLIGGVGRPSEGRVKVQGRIGALLDLGAGFHSDLTGRENVFVGGVVAGLTRREVARRLDAIVEFAELEASIDNPVRTYSSGMQMRLAFSIAVHTDPEILLIDEFLSVGDIGFQAKCLERINQFKSQGCAIVYISHSPEQIEQLCDTALWLRQGQIAAYGEPKVVVGQYQAEMRAETRRLTPDRPPQITRSGEMLTVNQNRFGSLEAEITEVQLNPTNPIMSGDPLNILIEYFSPQVIQSPIFTVAIRTEDHQVCLHFTTANQAEQIAEIQGQGQVTLHLDRLDLGTGRYFVDVGIYEKDWHYAYDFHWQIYPLQVVATHRQASLLCPPYRWQVAKNSIRGAVHSQCFDFQN